MKMKRIATDSLGTTRLAAPFALALILAALRPAAAEEMLDEKVFSLLLIDRLEYRWHEGVNTAHWNAQAWIGGDYNRIWFKSDGIKSVNGAVEEAEAQLLYSRLITPFWDLQAGVRYDDKPRPSRNYAVLGLQGLAPYWLEVGAAAFISEKGKLSARIEAEQDLLLSQRVILQPRFETNLAVHKEPELGVGQGVNDVDLALRLRYEIRREFAPYVGISWRRKLGSTASLARVSGQDVDDLAVVAGIRFWF